jgi:uncharacterized integral membrane protein
MRRFLFRASIVLAGLLALLISAMNGGHVEIELAFARFSSPLGLTLVFAFAIGLIVGLAWQIHWVSELLNERGRLRRALRLAEANARSSAAAREPSP